MTHSKFITTLLVSSTLLLFASCATVFRGAKTVKSIQIAGNPPAAKVYINNEYVGQTPLNYEVTKRKEMTVKIEKEGYKDLHTEIETKLNPLWTGISVVGNALLLEIPTIIDYKNGAISDIVTDSISYDLVILNSIVSNNSSAISTNASSLPTSDVAEEIISPVIRIRTSSQELILKNKTAITVKTKDGKTYKSAISAIETDYMVLKENNTKVYYSDIVKMRIFNTRRWFPILTSVSLVGPAVWFFSSVVVKQNTSDCSKKIHDIKVINHFEKREFGKTACKS
jgi:hypothetical protein